MKQYRPVPYFTISSQPLQSPQDWCWWSCSGAGWMSHLQHCWWVKRQQDVAVSCPKWDFSSWEPVQPWYVWFLWLLSACVLSPPQFCLAKDPNTGTWGWINMLSSHIQQSPASWGWWTIKMNKNDMLSYCAHIWGMVQCHMWLALSTSFRRGTGRGRPSAYSTILWDLEFLDSQLIVLINQICWPPNCQPMFIQF